MPILKFTIKGVEFQYIGEQDEIMAFISRFTSAKIGSIEDRVQLVGPEESRRLDEMVKSAKEKLKLENQAVSPLELTELPLPPDEAVISYITSKPQFEHHLLEIQRKFFGRVFSSRGKDQRMYHRTARHLRLIRDAIEMRYNGKFKEKPAGIRNLKCFTFVKNPVLPQVTLEEKQTKS